MELKGERVGQFQSAAYDLFNEHLKTKGKEPTYEERQTILDSLVKEIVIKPGVIWDTKGPAYQAPRDVRNAALTADKFTVGKVYTDANGNRVCPQQVQSNQTSRTATLSRPRLFRR